MANLFANLLKQAQPAINAGNNVLQDLGIFRPKSTNLNDTNRVEELKTRYATKELPKQVEKYKKNTDSTFQNINTILDNANDISESEKANLKKLAQEKQKSLANNTQTKALQKQELALTGVAPEQVNQFNKQKAQVDIKKQVGQPLNAQEQTIDFLSNPLNLNIQYYSGLLGKTNQFVKDLNTGLDSVMSYQDQTLRSVPIIGQGIKALDNLKISQINQDLNKDISADQRVDLLKRKSQLEATPQIQRQAIKADYKAPTFIENYENKVLGKDVAEGYRKQGGYQVGEFVGEILPFAAGGEITGAAKLATGGAKALMKTGIGKALAKYGGKETVEVLTKGVIENAIIEQPIGAIQEGAKVAGGEQTLGQAAQNQLGRTALAAGLGGVAELGIDKIGKGLEKGFNQLEKARKFEEIKAQRQAVQGERQARDADIEEVQNALFNLNQRKAAEDFAPTFKDKIAEKTQKQAVKEINAVNKDAERTVQQRAKEEQAVQDALEKLEKKNVKAEDLQYKQKEILGKQTVKGVNEASKEVKTKFAREELQTRKAEIIARKEQINNLKTEIKDVQAGRKKGIFEDRYTTENLQRLQNELEGLKKIETERIALSQAKRTTNALQDNTLNRKIPEIFNGVYKPKNQAELETTFKEVFGLNDKQATASSIITDRVLNTIAKRRGITPEEAFADLSFKKSNLSEVGKGAKFQGNLKRRDLTPADVEILKTGTLDDVKKLWESGTKTDQIMGELGKRFNGVPKKDRFSNEFLDYTKQQNRIKQEAQGFQQKTIEKPKKTRREIEDEIENEIGYHKNDLIAKKEKLDEAFYHPELEKEIPHDQRGVQPKGNSFTIINRTKSASRGKTDTSKSRSNYYVLGDATGKPLENLGAGYMDRSGQWVSNPDVQLRVSDHVPGTTYTPSVLRKKGFLQAKDDLWVNSDGEIAFVTHKPTDQAIASFVKSGQWDGFKQLALKKQDLYEAKYKELHKNDIDAKGKAWDDLFKERWQKEEQTPDIRFQSAPKPKKPKLNEKALQNINNSEPKNLTGKRPNLAEETGDTSIKQVFDNDGNNYNVKYEVIESPRMHASITKDFNNNPYYEFTNTRDRAGNLGLKSQVENMSNDIKPELLSLSNSIMDGSPIVGKNSNSVLSGNGRTAAIQRAYAIGKASNYKNYLIKNAKEFGLDPEKIQKMRQPVLARRVLDEDVNYQDFIEKANTSNLAARTPSEQAFADISSLDEADPTALRFIQKLSDSEKTALIDNKGKLNQYGEQRLANAKIAKAFGHKKSGKRLVEKLANAGDDGIKKISKAMGDNSAGFIKLKKQIRDGKIDETFDITDDFLDAIENYVDYKAMKAEARPLIDEYLGQADMFTGSSLSDSWKGTYKEGLFRELATDSMSRSNLSKSIKDYLELVEVSKNQLDMLGNTKQPHSLLNEAFETDNFKPKNKIPQKIINEAFETDNFKPKNEIPQKIVKEAPKEKISALTRQKDKNIEILQISQKARGALENLENRKQLIHALSSPDVSTPLHEIAHVYESVLKSSEKQDILDWAGSKEWDTNVSERFAEGFEKYLADGKAPIPELQRIFEDFKTWLTDIYKGITGSKIDLKLNNKMRKIYDEMIGANNLIEREADNLIERGTPNTTGKTKERGLIQTIDENPSFKEETKEFRKDSTYETRSSKDLFERASERVKTQDTESLAKEIRMKSRRENNWTDEEVATGYELVRKYEAEGKFDEAAELEDALAKKATEGGQMIQAYYRFGKTTPEGAIREANKVLEKSMPPVKAKQLKETTANVIKDFNKANKKAVENILNFCPPGSFS